VVRDEVLGETDRFQLIGMKKPMNDGLIGRKEWYTSFID